MRRRFRPRRSDGGPSGVTRGKGTEPRGRNRELPARLLGHRLRAEVGPVNDPMVQLGIPIVMVTMLIIGWWAFVRTLWIHNNRGRLW